MGALDVYIMAAKGRHEDPDAIGDFDGGDEATDFKDCVIAHGGHLNTDEWRTPDNKVSDSKSRTATLRALGTADIIGPAIVGFAGRHPAELLAALRPIWRALNDDEKKLCYPDMEAIQYACRHAIKLENDAKHGVLYQDVRVVVVEES